MTLQYIWHQCLGLVFTWTTHTGTWFEYNAEYLYIYLCSSALLPVTYQYINTISDACIYYIHQIHHITRGNHVKSAQSSNNNQQQTQNIFTTASFLAPCLLCTASAAAPEELVNVCTCTAPGRWRHSNREINIHRRAVRGKASFP